MMSETAWTSEETGRLIEAVRQRDSLYNPASMNYRNRSSLYKCWREVTEAVGEKSVSQCKDRWNVLRGIYRRQRKMTETSKAPRKFSWHWTDHMAFLNKYLSTPKPRALSPAPEEASPAPPPTPPVIPREEEPHLSLAAPLLFLNEADRGGEWDGRRVRRVKKRKCLGDLEEEIRGYLRMKMSNEEVDPFFVSVSREMARLSDRNKSLFKIRVQTLLHDFLYQKE